MTSITITNKSINNLDIICGRGRSFDHNPGNHIFRGIIKELANAYHNETSRRRDKIRLIQMIKNELDQAGMRFIKISKEGISMVLNDSKVKEKIGHALRDLVPAVPKSKVAAAQTKKKGMKNQSTHVDEPKPKVKKEGDDDQVVVLESLQQPCCYFDPNKIHGGLLPSSFMISLSYLIFDTHIVLPDFLNDNATITDASDEDNTDNDSDEDELKSLCLDGLPIPGVESDLSENLIEEDDILLQAIALL